MGPLEEALSLQRPNRTIENELERPHRSIPLAEQVVAQLDSVALAKEAGFEDEVPSRRHLAEYLLEKRAAFEQAGEDVDVNLITATAPHPQEAARIANVYAEEYQRHSRRISQTGAAAPRPFLEEQVGSYESRLRALPQQSIRLAQLQRAQQGAEIERLAKVAGARWQIERAFQAAKGECGLDEYEVRR